MTTPPLPRLLLVTDRNRTSGRPLVDVIELATRAGVRFVQIRDRDLDPAAYTDLLDEIVKRVPADTRIVLNGRPGLARSREVGLHLPAGDPRPDLGAIRLWGRSAHDRIELHAAIEEGASYVILGTVFPTESKPEHPGRGLDWLSATLASAATIPVFAIGGIDASRAAAARAAGAYGVAVCGAILAAGDPGAATTRLLEALERS